MFTRFMLKNYLSAKNKLNDLMNDESGEVNMIAIILIIIAVIALAGIFQDGLKAIINGLFTKIKTLLGIS